MRFVLIHGGWHGAWCWSRTIPELERLGHRAIAIDMPGNGDRQAERPTIAHRREALLSVMQPGDVLVGHSGGGNDITIAADARPDLIGHLIYLAASLPLEGRSILESAGGQAAEEHGRPKVARLMDGDPGEGRLDFIRFDEQGRMVCEGFESVRRFFYHDCDEETARWAYSKLTPESPESAVERLSFPNFWSANLSRSFIRCLQERAAPAHLMDRMVERLGVEPLTIDTSHSPFLSRPKELAELMVRATSTVPLRPPRPA
jgi:pimeloyl-ACP methyl ester carboxylesterase